MKHLKSKISRVLVLYIVLFSSMVTLVLTAIQLRLDYNEGINVIHQRIDQVKFTNIDSITQSLWTIDHSSIQVQLEGLSRINDIIFVKIADENNQLFASAGEITTDNTIIEDISLHHKYRGQDVPLGTLTIVATKENIYQQLIDTVIVILISQGIKTFLVSMFVLLIFYYLVTRHLEIIASHASRIELDSKPSTLILNRNDSKAFHDDELDQMVNSINSMLYDNYLSYKYLENNQRKLSERQAKFSAIFDSIPDAALFTDTERKIMQTNTAFQKQFGYLTEEINHKSTSMLYANPGDYSKQVNISYNLNSQSLPLALEVEYRRKDGSTFPSETMGGAVLTPDGSQIGFIRIIRDISARKQDEKEKIRLLKQLQQSQKMQAIGNLTGGIAHDFNNILASILGFSELALRLLHDTADPKLKKYIKHINIAGERARDLVGQLLAFSRSAPSHPQSIDLPVLIDDVISMIRPTIPSSIVLVTEIENAVPSVLMDNTQMHQMLMNLVINARDAMNGNGTLTVKLSYESDFHAICNSCKEQIQGDFVKLTVLDTGTGIDPDILETIFEPFQTTKDIGLGTGMGLSVVHGILHKHKSHIIVETALNAGTCFNLLIPPCNEHSKPPEIDPPSVKPVPINGNGKHLLVVDDEVSVLLLLEDLFETYDFKVTTTTSSKEAVNFVKHAVSDYDLIITDQTMPDLTGTDMIKQIFEINPNIPVILCSGYNEQTGEKEALELGCSKYMAKPVNNQQLIQSVHEILIPR